MKKTKKLITHIPLYILVWILLPKITTILIISGLIDFLRNRPLTWKLAYQYFFGSGTLTWVLSPFNLLTDLLTLRWRQEYKKIDFPKNCQNEINQVLKSIDKTKLINALQNNMKGKERGMIFFKWYGENIQNELTVPEFHQKFRYIKTIGVSAFNKQCSTSRHFGPLRLSVRLLYNLKPIKNNGIYIEVAGKKHHWHNNPLFIFDDTRVHQSFNQADEIRYCMFIDILRPSIFLPLLNTMLKIVAFVAKRKKFIFYKKWSDIGKPK